MNYRIFTDATADLPALWPENLAEVTVIPMSVTVDGKDYLYGPGGNITVKEFYELQRIGKFASTSQINPDAYFKVFIPALDQGLDILYLCFTSGLSGTYQNAMLAVQELRQQYPERKILVVDTLCASVGQCLLTMDAAGRAAQGYSLEQLFVWVTAHRMQVCHWFTVDVFEHLKHGGRVSAASAAMGTMLGIKPMLHVDDDGKLAVVEKPRGRKKAMDALLKRMDAGWMPDFGQRVIIGHGDDLDKAKYLQAEIEKKFPNAQIQLSYIGPVIGAHTGPGMLALIYWGNNR